MIAVFDTNVFIAAMITEGICSRLLHRARMHEFSLVSCPFIMTEMRRILSKKFRLSHDETVSAMEPIREAIHRLIEHDPTISDLRRDADDDNILACAVAAKADYLVTGDSDFPELGNCKGVKIVTPRDFEALFR